MPPVNNPSKMMTGITIALALFGAAALALAVYLYKDKTEKTIADPEQQEAIAKEVRHINAQLVRTNEPEEEIAEAPVEDKTILVNMFSVPTGADVFYSDGTYFGTTPIELKKIPKKAADETFIVSLDGYFVQKKTLNLNKNIQDTTELEKVPEVVVAPKPVEKKPVVGTTNTNVFLPD